MGKRRWLAAGSSLLAAAIGLLGAATTAGASTATSGGLHLHRRQHRHRQHHRRVRPARRRLGHSASGVSVRGGRRGPGPGLASQGAIQATPDGRYLLAANAGSSQISVLRVTAGGVPVLAGPPVSAGGLQPVSLAVSGSGLVYVANSSAGGSGYSGFRLHLNGSLTAIPGTTVTMPADAGLGDVFFNATGDHLIGTRTGTSQIDSFVVLPGGNLLAAKGSPFHRAGPRPARRRRSSARPPRNLFVSNAHNGAGLGTVSAFRDSLSGQLSPIGIPPPPYANGQTAPCWVEISHNGKYLFTVNTGSANISSYAINPDGSLTLIGSTPIRGGGADIDARLSPGTGEKRCPWTAAATPQYPVGLRRPRRHPHRAAQLTDATAHRGRPGRIVDVWPPPSPCPWPARAGQGHSHPAGQLAPLASSEVIMHC